MNTLLYERLKSENAALNFVWRFFADPNHQWRWERLAFDGVVLEQSSSGYTTYDTCVHNASASGYVYRACPASTKPKSALSKQKRSYMMRSSPRGLAQASQIASPEPDPPETLPL